MPENASDFYNSISTFYDKMTKFNSRLDSSIKVLETLFKGESINRALDVACGTGIYTLAMAKMGIESIGADISAESLEKARLNSKELNIDAKFIFSSMEDLYDKFDSKFDAVICLGNSIPHLSNIEQLNQTIKVFHSLLKDDAVSVIQIINYNKFLKEKVKKFNEREIDDSKYIRYYKYTKEYVLFNILELKKIENITKRSLFTTKLFPFKKEVLETAFINAGFRDISFYGGLNLSEFNLETSDNLVIVGRK